MDDNSFRFLHTGDFRLGEPLVCEHDLPSSLAEQVRDAPYRAVEHTISAALEQRVQLVVVVGDLWVAEAGPGPAEFVRQQFQRLAERDIPVVWAAGCAHLEDPWSSMVKFPGNVHRFSAAWSSQPIERNGRKLAEVTGQSWSRQATPQPPPGDLVRRSIVACCAPRIPPGWAHSEAPYWAVGGSHKRRSRRSGSRLLHSCGSPQARSAAAARPHGCTLVHVGDQIRTKPICTDVVRWRHERIDLPPDADLEVLRRMMCERVTALRDSSHDRTVFVCWYVNAPDGLGAELRHGGADLQCLKLHREDIAREKLSVVPTGIDVGYREFRAEWLDEDSLLSEFLQTVRDFRAESTEFHFNGYLPLEIDDPALEDELMRQDAETRASILRDAAALGVDLFTGDVPLAAFENAWGRQKP